LLGIPLGLHYLCYRENRLHLGHENKLLCLPFLSACTIFACAKTGCASGMKTNQDIMNYIELKQKSEELRLCLIDLIHSARTGHTGGDLSVLNLLTVLYYHFLHVEPTNPKLPDRDRLVLSKGHCAEALYCVLCDKGFFPKEELDEYGKDHAHLGGHPDVTIPGVEINTGALGHGLSAAVGMALSAKLSKAQYKTYVIMGDGEQAEGSVYEAAMAANKYHLDNLVAFIDRNGLQISGSTEDVMPLENIQQRWNAFGWDVKEMNGDDIEDVVNTIASIDFNNRKPHLIISKTTKGLGVSFMENKAKWHHGVPTEEQYQIARHEIEERLHKMSQERKMS
jgi:transketolase